MTLPTPENSATEPELDQDLLALWTEEYRTSPPAPYDHKLSRGEIKPYLDEYQALATEIATDPSLSPEQKAALHHELSERWHNAVFS